MRQITKTAIIAFIFLPLISCQTSKIGCYDFGVTQEEASKDQLSQYEQPEGVALVACTP